MVLERHFRWPLMAMGGVLALVAQAADWPQFRGADGSGVARDAKPPTVWSDVQNLKWRTPLPGGGTSSPILVGGRVFVTCWSGGEGTNEGSALKRYLVCLDRDTGKILWTKSIEGEKQADRYDGFLQEHGFASHTPASDGERVYVYFGRGGALAFDLTGRELWHTSLGSESNEKGWGSASSPVVYNQFVIINASEESHAIYALDKTTGKQAWKAEGGALSYVFGTPVLARTVERTELLLNAPDELWSMNPDTGKLRWYVETGLPGNIAPSVVLGDNTAYAFGGFPKLGAIAVKLGGKGNVTSTNIVWKGSSSTYVPTPVFHEGRIYFASDAGFAVCLDAKWGTQLYKERLPGASATGRGGKPFYASAVLANGCVYATSRQNGVFVFAATPEFKLIAHNLLPGDDSDFNATPALADRQIFLRSNRNLYCLETDRATTSN